MTEWTKDAGGLPPVVLLPAIQHTGSRFVRWDILKRYQHCQLNEAPLKRTVYYEHLSAVRKCERFIPLLGRYPAIASLRHPRRVFKSWQRRGQPLSQCIEEWTNLIEMVDPYKPYYMPIDAADRQDYLDRINADLGLNIVTDWLPRGNKAGTMQMKPEKIVLPDEVELFIESISDFTNRFWQAEAVATEPLNGVVFRNLTQQRIEAYGYLFMPCGQEGDTQKVKEDHLIAKFRLYDTLEMTGFKADGRWGEARKQAEYERWLTQQHS